MDVYMKVHDHRILSITKDLRRPCFFFNDLVVWRHPFGFKSGAIKIITEVCKRLYRMIRLYCIVDAQQNATQGGSLILLQHFQQYQSNRGTGTDKTEIHVKPSKKQSCSETDSVHFCRLYTHSFLARCLSQADFVP